jgi:hypothetical protein
MPMEYNKKCAKDEKFTYNHLPKLVGIRYNIFMVYIYFSLYLPTNYQKG